MLQAKLVIVGGDAKAGEISLELPTTIGRGKEADLTIPHALVSRNHSNLFEREGLLWVEDLGSLNGTFVDNTRIESEQVIEPNQLLTLGNITFRAVYQIDESARKTLPSTALPDSLQTIKIDPIGATAKPTPVSEIETDAGIAPDTKTNAPNEDTEPAPVFEEPAVPRSAISEIDSFDPDEIGSLDSMIEKNDPQEIAVQKIAPQVPLPKKRPRKQTQAASKPALRAPSTPKKSPRVRQSLPKEVAIDLGIESDARAPVSSIDLQLDLADNAEVAPVSFIGQIQTDNAESPSIVEDFQINIDSDGKPDADVDEVRFDSFLKKLPK